MLAALSMLGACCLTTLGEGDKYCGSNASWNPEKCYRRPDVDLLLTWFSTVIGEWEPFLDITLRYSRGFSSHLRRCVSHPPPIRWCDTRVASEWQRWATAYSTRFPGISKSAEVLQRKRCRRVPGRGSSLFSTSTVQVFYHPALFLRPALYPSAEERDEQALLDCDYRHPTVLFI